MPVSVIVSSFNGALYLPRLLESLEKQNGVTLEIIVVDRESSDGSAEILARHPDVRVITVPPEAGLVAGYSAAVPLARHDKLFFCNEDMWFDPDCVALLESHIDLSRKVACADPWQWSYDGSRCFCRGAQVRRRWNRGSPHPFYDLACNDQLPAGSITACACAGAMMVHRFAYEDVGGWDRTFFLDHEDTDFTIRLWQAGWHSVVVPEAKVYHAVGASNDKVIPRGKVAVSKRRYVLGASNQAIIAWKLFSPRLFFLPLLPWLERFSKNLATGRWRLAGWDLLTVKSALSRIPEIARFRRRNRLASKARPGEDFFREPTFAFGAKALPPAATAAPEGSGIRLSVALVTRNRPAYLEKCLTSWRSQSAQPYEIVVSDDSDESHADEIAAISRRFGCRYVSGPRRGLYANRNHAALACTGTHVMSADDDHTHPEGFVAAVMEDLRLCPDGVWAYGEKHPSNSVASIPVPCEMLPDNRIRNPRNLFSTTAIADGSSVYPAAIFAGGLRYDETYRFGGLWYLWGNSLVRHGYRIRISLRTFVWHDSDTIFERASDTAWLQHQLECGIYVAFRNSIAHRNLMGFLRGLKAAVTSNLVKRAAWPGLTPVRIPVRASLRAFRNALSAR